MTRGRKPKPTALKRLQGNPGKRPLNANEPQFGEYKYPPRPPKFLSREGQAEWRRIAPRLHAVGLLTPADRAALAGYCQAYGRWVKAEQELAKPNQTEVDLTPNGLRIQSVWLQISNRAAEEMRRWAVEFGMTPSSRSKIVMPVKTEEVDELDMLFRRVPGRVKVSEGER